MTATVPPVPATCEPRFASRSSFTGALLPMCGVEVLIVVVQTRIMSDTFEANLYVTAFNLRFRRTIVLMSQDDDTHAPTYYGPAGIVRALTALPFEMLPWQRMLFRVAKPAAWQLPVVPEREKQTGSYSSSIEELARTCIRTRDDPAAADVREAAAERMARSTQR